jgi:hypothetical protein
MRTIETTVSMTADDTLYPVGLAAPGQTLRWEALYDDSR